MMTTTDQEKHAKQLDAIEATARTLAAELDRVATAAGREAPAALVVRETWRVTMRVADPPVVFVLEPETTPSGGFYRRPTGNVRIWWSGDGETHNRRVSKVPAKTACGLFDALEAMRAHRTARDRALGAERAWRAAADRLTDEFDVRFGARQASIEVPWSETTAPEGLKLTFRRLTEDQARAVLAAAQAAGVAL